MFEVSDLSRSLQPYDPQVPTTELVEALNRHYHAFEACTYERQHAEIRNQLPPLWQQMIQWGVRSLPEGPLRILDFGCGTGFEANQLLEALPADQIEELWCFDPSPPMLERCRRQIAGRLPRAQFTSQFEEVQQAGVAFNLVTTNSVLHHLPLPFQTVDSWREILEPDAVWICGHEPSARYYRNPACRRLLERYLKNYRRRRLLTPSAYLGLALRWSGVVSTPAQRAARRAFEEGLFRRQPPARLVARLVDFHVPHSRDEVESGRGFDVLSMKQQLEDQWQLLWSASYSFMGPFYEGALSTRWQDECKRLRRSHPQDGANFCAVWQRRIAPRNSPSPRHSSDFGDCVTSVTSSSLPSVERG